MRCRAVLGAALVAACALPAPAAAIFHGTPAADGAAPWLALLRARTNVCGGALIAPDRVVTAAHCVRGVDPQRLKLFVGDGAKPRPVRWTGALHPPSYADLPATASVGDIAVLVLAAPVTDVAPLALATADPAPGTPLAVVGRGRTGPLPRMTKLGTPDPGAPSAVPLVARQTVRGCTRAAPSSAPSTASRGSRAARMSRCPGCTPARSAPVRGRWAASCGRPRLAARPTSGPTTRSSERSGWAP